MNRFARLLAAFAFGAVAAPLAAQTDGLPSLEPAAIAEAARSCAGALSPAGIVEQRLTADGWSEGKISADGKSVKSPLRFFGRNGAMLLLMPSADRPAGGSCTIMARIKSIKQYQPVVQATGAALAGRVAKSEKGSITWLLSGGRVAQIDPTGTLEKPSVRVTVAAIPAEKK